MIREFVYKYYIDPIRYGQPYTLVDTLTYALLLIAAVYLIHRWFEREGIAVDRDFILSTLPYVVLGGLLRVVQDTGLIQSDLQFLLVTPLIFFSLFVFTVGALYTARRVRANASTDARLRLYRGIGIVACAFVALVLLLFGISETLIALDVLGIILAIAFGTTAAVWLSVRYLLGWKFVADPLYICLIFGHMLDASATSFGIDLHPLQYVEQHVVGSVLIEWTGTAFAMFPLKLAVVVPALYVLEMYRREGNSTLWHLVILAMIVVGLAPGVRDMMRMVLYV
ncbi:MAG: DUF63 family protein [Methanomicrobiales archaeon]|nr:DUF63 family protein [Methanomicrobiales archaeon]MDI6875242.1 DUF63 family protein [Methanomicrobiales archaeon]